MVIRFGHLPHNVHERQNGTKRILFFSLFCLFDEEEFDGRDPWDQIQAELIGESLLEVFPALIRRGRIHG
jgi:hypothetical protein